MSRLLHWLDVALFSVGLVRVPAARRAVQRRDKLAEHYERLWIEQLFAKGFAEEPETTMLRARAQVLDSSKGWLPKVALHRNFKHEGTNHD